MQTFAIMGKSLKTYELRDADLVLQPALAGVSGADFTTRRQSIKAGRDVTHRPPRRAARAARREEPALTGHQPSRRQARPSTAEMPSTGSTPTL